MDAGRGMVGMLNAPDAPGDQLGGAGGEVVTVDMLRAEFTAMRQELKDQTVVVQNVGESSAEKKKKKDKKEKKDKDEKKDKSKDKKEKKDKEGSRSKSKGKKDD